MGKGDKRTKRGKIAAGTFGKTRPKKKNMSQTVVKSVVVSDKASESSSVSE